MIVAADEKSIGDGHWRGDDSFAHGNFGDEFEAILDARDEDNAILTGGIEDAVGEDG
jgi:hypothetical protein